MSKVIKTLEDLEKLAKDNGWKKREFNEVIGKERESGCEVGQKYALTHGLGKNAIKKIEAIDAFIRLLDELYEYKKEDYD